jgi:septum formation protein
MAYSTSSRLLATDLSSSTTASQQQQPAFRYNLLMSSSSRSRITLLQEIGYPYTMRVSPVDERGIGIELREEGTIESAVQLVTLLAEKKVGGVLKDLDANGGPVNSSDDRPTIILTADQVVTHPLVGILEKPNSLTQAADFFDAYVRHPEVTTVGSIRLTHWPSRKFVSKTFKGVVNFDEVKIRNKIEKKETVADGIGDNELLNRLVAAGAPLLSCAGGLIIEHPVTQQYVSSVEGGEDSVMGLSKETLRQAFGEMDELLV